MSSRRFTPAQKTTAPSTPHGASRVLPTPPASAAPAFRLPEDTSNTSLHRNIGNVNTRPQAAPAQPDIRPKLPLHCFSKPRKDQPGANGLATPNRGVNSPAHKNRTLGASEGQHSRRLFGQPNGLLPIMSPPRPPPTLVTRSAQPPASTRFSSPVSPSADDTTTEDDGNHALGDLGHDMDTSGPHTSGPILFDQAQVVTAGLLDDHTVYRRTIQTHSVARQPSTRGQSITSDYQGDYEEPVIGSPSPTTSTYAKRRAGDHNVQSAPKRMRVIADTTFEDDRYPSHEPETGPPSTALQSSQTLPRGYYSTSLEVYIENHQTEWIAAQKRWEMCTMEEWQNGPSELTAELDKVMDMVKKFMAERMEVYAGINKDVQAHKDRLDSRDTLLTKEKERLVKQAGGLAGGFMPN